MRYVVKYRYSLMQAIGRFMRYVVKCSYSLMQASHNQHGWR